MKAAWVLAAAVTLTTAAGSASAQTSVYKSSMPDGRIVYGDHPERGAARVALVETPQISIVHGTVPQLSSIGGAGVPSSRSTASRASALDLATQEVKEAAIALDLAKQRLEAGLAPQEGERTGTVSGFSRLNDFYTERTLGLHNQVAAAQARLDRAYAVRNALRD